MVDAKDVRCKSPINRVIVIIDIVILVNTKHLEIIERLLEERTKGNNMVNIKFPTKNNHNSSTCIYFLKFSQQINTRWGKEGVHSFIWKMIQ